MDSRVRSTLRHRSAGSTFRSSHSGQQQYGEQQRVEEPHPTFSLLYGAHGRPAPRVRALEAEVDVPVFAEEGEGDGQRAWWAAKAAELECGEDDFDDREEDGEDAFDDTDAVVNVEEVQQTHQTYAVVQKSRQNALDLEAYARVGATQRETFRNDYLALGMRYRGVRRARAEAFDADPSSTSSPPLAGSLPSGGDEASSEDGAGDMDASSSSSESDESDEEYADADADSDAGSIHSFSRSSSSRSSSRTRTRTCTLTRGSPYTRASRAGATARLVDCMTSFFGRMGV
ncbi:hypothetical protein DFH06DRAFT_57952 [Mycena polygramma]|nr:hypothetical protein DFH06DRAFT_57952 [Mycena polygramma]